MSDHRTNPFDLTGRLAVVTGAKRGIGRAMAVALARAGADVVGVSASLEESDSEVAREVEAIGRSFTAYRLDLSERAQVAELAALLAQQDRDIDILVNNAGIIRRAPAARHSDEYWDEVINLNLTSQFLLAREVGRAMIERRQGKIIFVGSLLSFQGGINVPGYAASKHGIAGLTRALANEWAQWGVNVNAIAPGYIATDNTQPLREDPAREQAILERVPAGRWGTGDDIGGTAVFLASAASDYVNGAVLPVDGGWLAR
jgi:2-deoxy-D-gluconate 3-dehydrogenase